MPFSLLWGGFSIFWSISALVGGAPVPFALFGVPFVALGLYFIFGRFIYKAKRKRQTVYGLTEGRALVAVGSGSLSEAPLQRNRSISAAPGTVGISRSHSAGRLAGGPRGRATPTPAWSCSTAATVRLPFSTSSTS